MRTILNCVFILVSSVFVPRSGADKSTRVIGGRLARPNEVPYIVSIQKDNEHTCGGSILNERFIITAAHCLGTQPNFTIIAGTVDYTNLGNAQVVKSAKGTYASEYKGKRRVNEGGDIALLELDQPLRFTPNVQPIPIPPAGTVFSGTAVLSGWGRTQAYKFKADVGDASKKLMTVDLKIVPNAECYKLYSQIAKKDIYDPAYKLETEESEFGMALPAKSILCAGGAGDGKTACLYDSGGPLQCSTKIDGRVQKYLCGIVSYGYGCGTNLPGGYTEVAKYTDWILENIN